jgi:hypothetical protein
MIHVGEILKYAIPFLSYTAMLTEKIYTNTMCMEQVQTAFVLNKEDALKPLPWCYCTK